MTPVRFHAAACVVLVVSDCNYVKFWQNPSYTHALCITYYALRIECNGETFNNI